MSDQHLGAVIIGGSQAGLAVGYCLKQHGLPFVILDENNRIGDAWRKRWDSLRLFTPGRYDGLRRSLLSEALATFHALRSTLATFSTTGANVGSNSRARTLRSTWAA